jgi:hypothetical protein
MVAIKFMGLNVGEARGALSRKLLESALCGISVKVGHGLTSGSPLLFVRRDRLRPALLP